MPVVASTTVHKLRFFRLREPLRRLKLSYGSAQVPTTLRGSPARTMSGSAFSATGHSCPVIRRSGDAVSGRPDGGRGRSGGRTEQRGKGEGEGRVEPGRGDVEKSGAWMKM